MTSNNGVVFVVFFFWVLFLFTFGPRLWLVLWALIQEWINDVFRSFAFAINKMKIDHGFDYHICKVNFLICNNIIITTWTLFGKLCICLPSMHQLTSLLPTIHIHRTMHLFLLICWCKTVKEIYFYILEFVFCKPFGNSYPTMHPWGHECLANLSSWGTHSSLATWFCFITQGGSHIPQFFWICISFL